MDVGLLTARLPPGADALRTAIWLLDRGLWPVPISAPDDARSPNPGKAPIGKGWGQRRPGIEQLRAAYRWHRGAGIGLLLGPRGKVVDLEVDDPSRAAPELARIFPAGIPDTIGWSSARGEHRLFLWDARIPALATSTVVVLGDGAIELRLGGADKQLAAVCPPTVGTDGKPRAWNGTWRIAPIPEDLLAELARRMQPGGAHPVSRTASRRESYHVRDRYVRSALEREVELVRVAGPGSRNRALNRAAFSLGQLVGGGAIPREEVETALRTAAAEAGLADREILPTLRSGIEAGLRNPRPLPEDGGERDGS
jgi:hypothetical protein